MSKTLKLLTFLLGVIIFLAPTNLFHVLTTEGAYVNGLKVDYLIPRLYLSQIFVGVFLLVGAGSLLHKNSLFSLFKSLKIAFETNKTTATLIAICSLMIIINSLRQSLPAGGWYIFSVALLLPFPLIIKKLYSTQLKRKFLQQVSIVSLAVTTVFQSLVAIYQFFFQKSVYGYFFLGEPNLSKFIGLAKITLNGRLLLLPYATTAHPNVLGGFISLYLIIFWALLLKVKIKKPIALAVSACVTIIGLVALILTFSISAWLTAMVGVFYLFSKYKLQLFSVCFVLFIITPIAVGQIPANIANRVASFDQNSLTRREFLNYASVEMFKSNPLMGTGLNSFTRQVEKHSFSREVVRFVQPAHHVGLLFLAETGLLGVLLLFLLVYRGLKKGNYKKILGVFTLLAPALTLDHYLVTIFPGLLLLLLTTLFAQSADWG